MHRHRCSRHYDRHCRGRAWQLLAASWHHWLLTDYIFFAVFFIFITSQALNSMALCMLFYIDYWLLIIQTLDEVKCSYRKPLCLLDRSVFYSKIKSHINQSINQIYWNHQHHWVGAGVGATSMTVRAEMNVPKYSSEGTCVIRNFKNNTVPNKIYPFEEGKNTPNKTST